MATSLLDIPAEVISTSLLPQLSVNEVLRTRRVCQWFKSLSDDHLRRHPRSRNTMEIRIPERKNDGSGNGSFEADPRGCCSGVRRRISLKTFLEEENQLAASAAKAGLGPPILIPVSRFLIVFQCVHAQDFQCPLLGQFLARYGSQVRDLRIARFPCMFLSEDEANFYQQLPNVKHFSLQEHDMGAIALSEHITAPESPVSPPPGFSELTILKVEDVPNFPFWQLIELCTNLKALAFRNKVGKAECFRRLLTILDRNCHKKLEFLDFEHVHMKALQINDSEYRQLMCEFYAVVAKLNLKLINVSSTLFDDMDETQRNQFAPRILSLGSTLQIAEPFLDAENILNVKCLPNLEAIKVGIHFFQRVPDNRETIQRIISRNLRVLSTKKMPNLRKLEITTYDHYTTGESSRTLARIWSNFPNLEELYFDRFAPVLEDVAFIGELEELPFLKLNKLKILHLGVVDRLRPFSTSERNPRKGLPVTDASFIRVFSQMKLREFRFESLKPLPNVTVAGIRALHAGPFGETIQLFPFIKWSLEGVSRQELQLVSKEFPCNTF